MRSAAGLTAHSAAGLTAHTRKLRSVTNDRRMLVLGAFIVLLGAGPPIKIVPPSADADVGLADGRTLHLRALPLGQMDGVVRDGVRFDAGGSRVALLATFPGGSIDGDWRTANPVQAYVADASRHTLIALTGDGQARGIRWLDATHVIVTDGGARRIVFISPPAANATRRAHLSEFNAQTGGRLVSPPEMFRLEVYKNADGSYQIGQVGAVRLRTVGIAPGGSFAVIGSFLAWIDGARTGGPPISRSGLDEISPPAFAGSAYGSTMTTVMPLGHFVYQGAYRNGVAHFAFSFGLSRVVASTRDFANWEFPSLPKRPAFTAGDGLGGGGDGILYFARPEDGLLQIWKRDHYIDRTMQFPDDARDTRRLFDAMAQLAGGESAAPPMHPDADALDSALLEWRIYPVGDVTGDAWIASFLGRTFAAGNDLRFKEIAAPAFPFAVLGRTDDGRIWAAAPLSRTVRAGSIVSAAAQLFSTRDGKRWTPVATLNRDPGAVGLHEGVPWVAMSANEQDAPGVEVVRLDRGSMAAGGTPIGAIYAGEDMFLADLESGFYLVCGGAPGTRADDESGPYIALKLDPAQLSASPENGINSLLTERIDPSGAQHRATSDLGEATARAFLDPSVAKLRALDSPGLPTIASNTYVASLGHIRSLTLDDEREFEVEYAWRPFPISNVTVHVSADSALVDRTIARGPLAVEGWSERWKRDETGAWTLAGITSHWRI